MTRPLSLAQRLALVKHLTDTLAALRKGDLLPQAAAEMPSGSRVPVMFAGRHAGWVTMPAPSKSAAVTDDRKLMAWAQESHPGKIGTRHHIEPTPDVLALVREKFPDAVRDEPVLNEYWLTDIRGALVKQGYWVSADGEKVAEIPGIEVSEGTAVPRVNLADDAAAIIGAAWLAGDIPAEELLALPALPAADDRGAPS